MSSVNRCLRIPWLAGALGLLCALPPPGLPAPAEGEAPPSRPRIGLVLGGGGAKGAAHIGVLRVLDELRVPVDCVAGTSMGALVGATFAAGMAPADIEKAVLAVKWSKTVGTEGLRERTPIQRKLAGITYTNNLDLGLKRGRIKAPGGLLKTQDIEDLLRNLVFDARYTRDFDDLPIPFRAVATDMRAGEMVVIGSGDLSVAMRASMAVPGAFSPVVMGDKVLSDGGLTRNLPVDIARQLCADVVIAVSLASPPPETADLVSAVGLASRSLDVMIDANTKQQLATLNDRDVSIVVPMGDIGSTAFDRIPDAIPLGRDAALAQRALLSRYSLPEDQYAAWRARVEQTGGQTVMLADVRVSGLRRVNPEYVQAQLHNAAPGREVTTAGIIDDTSRIYALGDFERVEYSLTGTEEARTLDIRAVEKSWGPHFLRFDLGLGASGGGDLQFALTAEHEKTWVNSLGGNWRNALQVGQTSRLETGLYQPLEAQQRFFVEPLARYERSLEEVYVDGERTARYVFKEGLGQVDLGVNIGTRAQLRAGLRRAWGAAELDTGPPVLPEQPTTDDTDIVLGAVYDTRDAVGLPTRGTLIKARYMDASPWLGGHESYKLAEGAVVESLPWRGDTLSLFAFGGAELDGKLPAYRQFQLGGLRSFPGLERGQWRGDSYWSAGAAYLWKVADIQSMFGQALYAGLRLQAGRMAKRVDDVTDGTVYGTALSLNGRTPVGPFLLSIGGATDGSWQVQFGIGRPIEEGTILDQVR